MAKYIERDVVDKVIETARKMYLNDFGAVEVIQQIKSKLYNMPNADVQPVNQWISVDEALPENENEVLVYYQYYWGKGDIAKGCGISRYYYRGKWSTLYIPIDGEVLYWKPLPEPPEAIKG